MATINAAKARDQLSELINRAAYKGERVILSRRNKAVAAVISIEDLETLEAMEDAVDVRDAEKILKSKPSYTPLSEVKAKIRSKKPK